VLPLDGQSEAAARRGEPEIPAMAIDADREEREPIAAPSLGPILPPAAPRPTLPGPREPVLFSDKSDSGDLLGVAEAVRPLAELCLSPEAQTPFLVGIVGPSGAGKSFALRRLVGAIDALANAAAKTPGGPFLQRIVMASVDAAGVSADPASALAAAAFVALERDRAGVSYPALADEAAHATTDPRRAALAAADRLDEIVRRLETERVAREEVEAKRARLPELLLYETPGSRVDSFIRTSRAGIDARLRRFGLGEADTTVNYRDLVRDLSSLGAGSQFGLVLRAIWAYRGQARLLASALISFLLAFGLDRLRSPGADAKLRGLGVTFAPVADWIAGHGEWLEWAVDSLIVLGFVALFVNVWRALSFSALLYRGLRILNLDIRERRRELDASLARLERRIAALSVEAEGANKRAETMTKRAGGNPRLPRAPGPIFLGALESPAKVSREFFSELSRLLSASGSNAMPAPQRLIFVIDNLEALAPVDASRLIETASALFGPGCIGLVACDPAALTSGSGGGSAPRAFAQNLFQVVFDVSSVAATNVGRLAGRLLTASEPPSSLNPIDASRSAVGEPLTPGEGALLTALTPLTSGTPRAVKRFHNAYRLARIASAPRPVVALMLAAFSSPDENLAARLRETMLGEDSDLANLSGPDAWVAAIKVARVAHGGPITKAEALAAWDAARRYAPSDIS
jgi:hypothetical protein